jgi:CheY-like chemotaxis protein
MDGRAAVKVLKGDPRTSTVPTVALTAQAMAGDRETILAAGFDGYITKPIDTRSFIETLQRFLAGGSSV